MDTGNEKELEQDLEYCTSCKQEPVAPGEDECYTCLGQPDPIKAPVGSEEWKREMRENWNEILNYKGEW